MSEEAQLEKALEKLRKAGKSIGEPSSFNDEPVIPVGGVLMTHEQIFQLAEIASKTS